MVSKTPSDPDWPGRTIDLLEFGRRIAARKAELGLPDPPRDAGQNRTASKRALLKAIEEAGGSGDRSTPACAGAGHLGMSGF
jgi:hypothetical protein